MRVSRSLPSFPRRLVPLSLPLPPKGPSLWLTLLALLAGIGPGLVLVAVPLLGSASDHCVGTMVSGGPSSGPCP